MKKSIVKSAKAVISVCMAAALAVTGIPTSSLTGVKAEGTPVNRPDSSMVYFVDCGDYNTSTVPEDGQLGTHNSVTEQIYGEDSVTGYKWGIVDTVSNPLTNGAGVGKSVSTDWTWSCETSVTSDQTSKTATNRYTKNQFEKNVNRHIDYKFEIENGTYYVEIGLADPWGVSKTPTIYTNYGKTDQKTLGENVDVNKPVAGTVAVTDGELTINLKSESAAINVSYIEIKTTGDEAMAQTDADAIVIPETATSNMELPVKGAKAKSNITWKSSNEAVISTKGTVNRPASGKADVVVTLTAVVTYGEAKVEKSYTVKVPALNELMGLEYFDRESVEVTDAYYDKALDMDVENLLKLDADRLLAGFRETAAYAAGWTDSTKINAFMKNKTRYGGGWENSLIGGHTLGHYMSAVAQGIVNPGTSAEDKAKLTERLNYLVDSLSECQEMTKGTNYEGYLFGATLPTSAFKNDVDLQFDNVEKGLANISTQAWVPWYTMHKILAGLTDAYEVAGNEKALETANKLATWISARANGWSAGTQNTVLSIEYGGMNDALYQLYKVTNAANREEFKSAAHKFDEVSLFDSVLSGGKNVLNGKHANTTIPKFLGALCRYEVDNSETKYLQYAESFWQMVMDDHTYITGGNSENEHFGADLDLDCERTNTNNETCNTYNMLKLSRRLFMITGDKKYADYYENTLINAIMSSQNHETGLTMYFQPMATGYQKVFGTLDTNFWCCTGSGYENFTKLQDSIYFKKTGLVAVNQYLASTVTQAGYTIKQTGDLSKTETMKFEVSGTKIDFGMRLRIPDWTAERKVVVMFGDEKYEYTVNNGYIVIPNEKIKEGAAFTVTLPMEVRAYNLPDGENTYAFKYGPFVLSAKLGASKQTTYSHGVAVTVPGTKAVTSDSIGITGAQSVEDFMKNINSFLVKTEGTMDFTLKGTNMAYTFTTHYNQDTENYGIYWTYYFDQDGRGSATVLAEKEAKRLEHVKIDAMEQVGRGQYESRFLLLDGETKDGLVENGTSIGMDAPQLTRKAAAGSSFGYKMIVAEGEDNYVLVTYAKADDGKPMKVSVGDTVLFEGILDSTKASIHNLTLAEADKEEYYQILYKIPASVVAANVTSLEVLEEQAKVTKRVITVMFGGTKTEESARVCKSLSMVKAFGTNNTLTAMKYNGKEITANNGVYNMTVPYHVTPEVNFGIADSYGYIEINGKAIDEKEAKKLKLAGTTSTFTIKVFAEDFTTSKTYTLKVTRDYSSLNLKNNLIKAFTFEGTTDGSAAVSKASVPAVIKNPAYTYETGKFGKAMTLNGSYGLKLLDDASVLGEAYTISFWMKAKSVGNQFNPTITAGTFSPEYWLNLTLDGKIWSKNGDYIATPASSAYVANQWQHVALVVNPKEDENSTGTLYVDGEVVSTGSVASGIMTKSKGKVYFGVNAWDALFQGGVDDIMLFNKALTDAEVSGLMDSKGREQVTGKPSNPTINKPTVKPFLKLSKTSVTLYTGKVSKTAAIQATVTGKSKTVVWKAANPKIVTVKNGRITALKKGSTTVRATANGITRSVRVTVKNPAITVKKITVKKGKTKKVTVKVKPAKSGIKLVKLSAKQKKIAKVTLKSGKLIVKGKKKGSFKVTLKSGKGTKKVKIRVKK